jgi:hypothetical protein
VPGSAAAAGSGQQVQVKAGFNAALASKITPRTQMFLCGEGSSASAARASNASLESAAGSLQQVKRARTAMSKINVSGAKLDFASPAFALLQQQQQQQQQQQSLRKGSDDKKAI